MTIGMNDRADQMSEAPASEAKQMGGDHRMTRLPIDRIECYERNPRLLRNPMWDAIKASIRSSAGLTESLSVTRRPGAAHYVVHQGGNTRLRILKELYAETADESFRWVDVAVHTFTDEMDLAALHDRENTCRGDLTYIEEAWSKFRQYELYCANGLGKPTAASFVRYMHERYGMSLTAYAFSRMKFAVEVLHQHIPTCLVQGGMSQRDVRELIRIQNALEDIWNARKLGTKSEFNEVFFELLSRQDKDLAVSFLPADREHAVFPDERIGIDWATFREDFTHELTIVADVDHQEAEAWIASAFRSGEMSTPPTGSRPPSSATRDRDSGQGAERPMGSEPTLMELRASALQLARRFSAGTAVADCVRSTPGHGFGYRLDPMPGDCPPCELAKACWSILALCSGIAAPLPPKASITDLLPRQLSIWASLINVQARIAKLADNVTAPSPDPADQRPKEL